MLGEARRREEETRNRQVLDSALDYAIVAADLAGKVTRWNEGARRVLGWTEAEMLGADISRIFTPEDRAGGAVEDEMRRALEDGRAKDERWHVRCSGERFWANGRMTPLRDAGNAVVGFVKVLRDQTAEHEAAEAMRALRDRLQRAQQAGGVGVFSVELGEDKLYGSPEFCRIFGVADCDGVPTATLQAQILAEDVGVTSTPQTRGRGEVAHRVEYRIRHAATGEVRTIARSAEIERDESGAPVRLVGVVQTSPNAGPPSARSRPARPASAPSRRRCPTMSGPPRPLVWSIGRTPAPTPIPAATKTICCGTAGKRPCTPTTPSARDARGAPRSTAGRTTRRSSASGGRTAPTAGTSPGRPRCATRTARSPGGSARTPTSRTRRRRPRRCGR